jgi:hypothetical protein
MLDLLTAARQLLSILATEHRASVPLVVFYDSCPADDIPCILYTSAYRADHRFIVVYPGLEEEELLKALLHEFAHHRDLEYGLPCDCRYPCDSDACEFLAHRTEEEWRRYIGLWRALLGNKAFKL